MLLLQGQREPVDDRAQDLQKLGYPVVLLAFVNYLKEKILNTLADKRTKRHQLTVYAMEDRLEVVPLARVLRVKQLQQLQHKRLIYILASHARIHVI